jgi:hypothetical protein
MRRKRRENHEVEDLQLTPSASEAVRSQTVPFAQKLTRTINEACEVTGIGRTKLYELIGGWTSCDDNRRTPTTGGSTFTSVAPWVEHLGVTVCDSSAG